MTEFNPPISERETEELIEIAHSSTEHWKLDAINQAKKELIRRNVTQKEQNEVIEKWKKEADEYFKNEADRLEKNKTESYSTWEMILIFIIGSLKFFRWYDDVFTLRKENYYLKFKQRIIILTLGFISWFIFIYTSFHSYEQKRLEEIEKIDISDWKKKHGYE
ncbi:hypothetical protein [Psychroflexus halocasei]|uniref:Uncharacterized protein n=1 Tax=Psychroflexus halocasei TaxID=908615 RepID=A0A1H4DSJ2_9FLAO|nr:hypothetical protein [Psychroflexus halocasei]SEA75478.1 hypothetical protein SAMN05421540_11413 [Psychroflexus halocasei]